MFLHSYLPNFWQNKAVQLTSNHKDHTKLHRCIEVCNSKHRFRGWPSQGHLIFANKNHLTIYLTQSRLVTLSDSHLGRNPISTPVRINLETKSNGGGGGGGGLPGLKKLEHVIKTGVKMGKDGFLIPKSSKSKNRYIRTYIYATNN